MIPQHNPIEPGTIYGGEYPGDINAAVASRTYLRASPITDWQKGCMRRFFR